jgi:hypothetical protein
MFWLLLEKTEAQPEKIRQRAANDMTNAKILGIVFCNILHYFDYNAGYLTLVLKTFF